MDCDEAQNYIILMEDLNADHYWAFIKDNISKSRFKCDDRSILKLKPSALNNTTSYVLFYVRS